MSEFSKPRRITADDDLTGFECGVPIVDGWVEKYSRMALKRHTAVAYGSFQGGVLAGFYTLSAYAVDRASAHGWLARNSPDPVPALLLGMLGVDIRYQTRHLGASLLRDAVIRASSAAEIIGARALVVEPANDSATGFYERYGFRHVSGSGMLFIPLEQPMPY